MATKEEVLAAVAEEAAEVSTRINDLSDQVQALQDQIAAGGTVSAADLDDIKAAIQGIFTPAVVEPPPEM